MGQTKSGQLYLGSIDYISSDSIRTQLNLMNGADEGPDKVGNYEKSVAPLPMLDLCVMIQAIVCAFHVCLSLIEYLLGP